VNLRAVGPENLQSIRVQTRQKSKSDSLLVPLYFTIQRIEADTERNPAFRQTAGCDHPVDTLQYPQRQAGFYHGDWD
jgi:hypothetical protein